jgi:hypothetical protein
MNNKKYVFSKPTVLMLFCLLMSFCTSSCIRKNYDDATLENKENQNKFFELLRFCSPKGNILWEEKSQSSFIERGFENISKDTKYFKIQNITIQDQGYFNIFGCLYCTFSTENIKAKNLRIVVNSELENLSVALFEVSLLDSAENSIKGITMKLTESKNGISDKTIDIRSAKYIKLAIEFLGNNDNQQQYLLMKSIKMYADGKDLDSTRVILKRIKYYYE